MDLHFFLAMVAFGALIGGYIGGSNWRHYFKALRNDTNRDQRQVRKHIFIGVVMGIVIGAILGFFVPFLNAHHLL